MGTCLSSIVVKMLTICASKKQRIKVVKLTYRIVAWGRRLLKYQKDTGHSNDRANQHPLSRSLPKPKPDHWDGK